MNKHIRNEVMAEVISVMAKAEEAGLDSWKAAANAFPGIPIEVLAAASCDLGEQQTERWWQTVERTIDGEVIRNAIAAAKPG